MRHAGRFALALALCVALALAAMAGVISRGDRDALSADELLRLETLPEQPTSAPDERMKFMFELLGGTRRVTEADVAVNFTPEFIQAIPVEELNLLAEGIVADSGGVSLLRFHQREPRAVSGLGVGKDGTTGQVLLAIAEDGRIEGLLFPDYPGEPTRLSAWKSALIFSAAALFIGGATVAFRYRYHLEAWMLLAASIPTLATVAVLSDSSLLYSAGRILPGLTVVFAAALLLDPNSRSQRFVVAITAAAAVAGGLAPLARDSVLIGHPPVVGAFTDNETLYRGLLASSGVLAFLAMGSVAAVNIAGVRSASRPMRPALLASTAIALLFAVAAIGSAIDSLAGDGTLAGGPFEAIGLTALAAVPAALILRLVVETWTQPEIAALVIDLESDGTELQPALARALGDPSLQLLTSPDGQRLLNEADQEVSPNDVAAGQALTRIQSGVQLVGGLIHTSELKRDPARLEAVAAAAGMALDLRRLNRQVVAQLDEVNASRTRILQASDTARRQLERDLHDGAQQRLVALGLLLQRARRQTGSANQDRLAALLEDATSEVRDTIEEVRAVSRGRQPALLAERGLAPAVDALAERAPVPVRIDIMSERLPASVERTAYYVVAEGLTNMAKHSVATTAAVSITRRNGDACITIQDDGRGGAEMAAGSGLEGLNDRIAAAGGTFSVLSGPDGTMLKATIPCE